MNSRYGVTDSLKNAKQVNSTFSGAIDGAGKRFVRASGNYTLTFQFKQVNDKYVSNVSQSVKYSKEVDKTSTYRRNKFTPE